MSASPANTSAGPRTWCSPNTPIPTVIRPSAPTPRSPTCASPSRAARACGSAGRSRRASPPTRPATSRSPRGSPIRPSAAATSRCLDSGAPSPYDAFAVSLKRTPLYEAHRSLGAKLVPFAGWEMPVQYTGIVDEHKAVREAAGAFDVSHMGEVVFHGPRAAEAVQRLVTNDVGKLTDGAALYTVMCLDSGGIVDDCIVYRHSGEDFLIVVNASNREKDFGWMRHRAGDICVP